MDAFDSQGDREEGAMKMNRENASMSEQGKKKVFNPFPSPPVSLLLPGFVLPSKGDPETEVHPKCEKKAEDDNIAVFPTGSPT